MAPPPAGAPARWPAGPEPAEANARSTASSGTEGAWTSDRGATARKGVAAPRAAPAAEPLRTGAPEAGSVGSALGV